MNINPTAAAVVDACETAGAEHMVTGAFAFNCCAEHGTSDLWRSLLESLPPL